MKSDIYISCLRDGAFSAYTCCSPMLFIRFLIQYLEIHDHLEYAEYCVSIPLTDSRKYIIELPGI